MLILSHRGYWKRPEEKNTETAFVRSFTLGFGTETDVRDAGGQLVISHDPPDRDAEPLPFARFCTLYKEHGGSNGDGAAGLPLALNIKADGLQNRLADALAEHDIQNGFVFDMSVPDALGYLRRRGSDGGNNGGPRVFTRRSEYEPVAAFYEEADGVWLDGFFGEWVGADDIAEPLALGKQVCLVSPELHGRAHQPFWERLADWKLCQHAAGRARPEPMLCTDYPQQARAFFDALRNR